jgi:hypothetical protein
LPEAATTSADPRRARLLLAALVALAAVLRVWVALQPGLWADELFSLAMATGHGLEHAAAVADPAEGDYVEPRGAEPAGAFRRYLAHETPPAGFRRVLRAVAMSDTSPPLYYLVLDLWLRVAGTSDAALRLFSAACALLAMPFLWSVGRLLGGVRVAAIACLLFALAPPALYYSGEGRMYALTWLLGVALARLTLALARGGPRAPVVAGFVLVAAAGLLTHYFFAFVWLALLAWLALFGARVHWRVLVATTVGVLALILPWYAGVPARLAAWRVTGDWLDTPLTPVELAFGIVRLGASLVAGRGIWGGGERSVHVELAAFVVLAAFVLARGARPLLASEKLLPAFWLAASVLGPVVLDLLRHTATSRMERYALPGLPAAMLVVALALDHVSRPVGIAVLAATVITWLPGIRDVPGAAPRPWEPYPTLAAELAGWRAPDDLVIVNSIPSGVLGVARYIDPETPLASWVVQLNERRMPADAEDLSAGRCRIAIVRAHHLGAIAPVEKWLRTNAHVERELQLYRYPGVEAAIVFFRTSRCDPHAAR